MTRLVAIGSLALLVVSAAILVEGAVASLLRGLAIAALLVVAGLAGWAGILRRGAARSILLALGAALLVAAIVVGILSGLVVDALVPIMCWPFSLALARRAFGHHVRWPAAPRPRQPVVIWNPRSGAARRLEADLAAEAPYARGIEPIELAPGDDIVQLVRDAIAAGADAIAAAGGDGTALVASLAAEHDLPFA